MKPALTISGAISTRLGAADVLLQPLHFRIAHEVRQRRLGLVDEHLLLALRIRRRAVKPSAVAAIIAAPPIACMNYS